MFQFMELSMAWRSPVVFGPHKDHCRERNVTWKCYNEVILWVLCICAHMMIPGVHIARHVANKPSKTASLNNYDMKTQKHGSKSTPVVFWPLKIFSLIYSVVTHVKGRWDVFVYTGMYVVELSFWPVVLCHTRARGIEWFCGMMGKDIYQPLGFLVGSFCLFLFSSLPSLHHTTQYNALTTYLVQR